MDFNLCVWNLLIIWLSLKALYKLKLCIFYPKQVIQYSDFPTFLKSGPGACLFWENSDQTFEIGKAGFSDFSKKEKD